MCDMRKVLKDFISNPIKSAKTETRNRPKLFRIPEHFAVMKLAVETPAGGGGGVGGRTPATRHTTRHVS